MARTTRDGILAALKRRGEARAEELASSLGVTVSALRQHLVSLTGEGLVGHREVRSGPGRPKHFYSLTAAAEALFPKTYDELVSELLEYVSDEDPALLERVFERRRERRVLGARARLAGLSSLEDKVVELARILDEDGYLAEVVPAEAAGAFRVVEHNCAILGVAARYGQACTSEIDFIRTVLPEAEVDRVSHILAGARQCAYEIRPRAGGRRRASVV
ncbi:MAG TPA: ArsR family transcriptional regulator [Acidimicrobiales bacterium]|jgi:DeoR family suf operon transcriptional repressor|nr:ArsR family transcriptional regulator [Acidimicrobiales bacterium]